MRAKKSSWAGRLLVAGVVFLALAAAVAVVIRLTRPVILPAMAPAPLLSITYFSTATPAGGVPRETVTAIAREREVRRISQAATTVARATTVAALASPTPRPVRRIASTPLITPEIAVTPTAAPAAVLAVSTATPAPPGQQAVSPACAQTEGKLVRDVVHSAALGQAIPIQIFVPPCFEPKQYRYPALYLLQGSGDVEGQWPRIGFVDKANKLMASGELPPFLIVMPDTDIELGDASKYLYSSGGPGSYEDFIVNELIPLIDSKHAGWNDPTGRAIGGISRGGYWSLEIAFRNPRVFGSVGGHSPVISSDYLIGAPDDFQMTMMAHSLEDLKVLRVFLDVGNEDTWTMRGPDELSHTLSMLGVRTQFTIGPGTHEDAYWASRVLDYLAFYTAPWFAASPVAAAR